VLAAACFILLVIGSATFAGFVSPHDPYAQSIRTRMKPPMTPAVQEGAPPYILGTDQLGRDVLTRLIYGARISLTVGIATALFSGTVGVTLGLIAGFYRGRIDDFIMRLVDLQMSLPGLLLALFVLYALGPGFQNLILVMIITRWMVYARITRGMMLSLRERPFVEAARALGCTDRRLILLHMLPNLFSPIIVLATLEIATMMLALAALDFLGLGIQPPDSSWGLMLAQGREYITSAWWQVTFPGLAILLTALSFNVLATWVRVITDPVSSWRWIRRSSARAPA
jgi:peptide/nickel transport system permease protein